MKTSDQSSLPWTGHCIGVGANELVALLQECLSTLSVSTSVRDLSVISATLLTKGFNKENSTNIKTIGATLKNEICR